MRTALGELKHGDQIIYTVTATIEEVLEEEDGHVTVTGILPIEGLSQLTDQRVLVELFVDTTPNLVVLRATTEAEAQGGGA